MQQLVSVWSALESRRRGIVVLATVAMFAAVLMLSRIAATPKMSLLYTGLESSAAGEVVAKLEQQSVTYEVRGTSIFVSSDRRDELRMTLAGEGLPSNNAVGYELLDTLSGFGTTSQMFDAAYWRAKEGELARTIISSPHIRGARVHIANPMSQSFRRKTQATASVTVTTATGSLSTSHAKALKFLVSSAVAGLVPEDVAIIDAQGGLIMGSDDTVSGLSSHENRAAVLKKSVERLLEARVGYGNAVVEVSVDTITDRESIVERTFDPDTRVVISTDTEERTTTSEDARGGAVTVASNLPEGDAGSDSSSTSQNSETRERVNYEVSEVQREIFRSPGAVKRLTVAVLVDGTQLVDDAGAQVFQPRSDEEMSELHDLVAAAVGFDEARGDVITIKSMEFKSIAEQGSVAQPSFIQSLNLNIMSLVQLAVLAVVSLVLGLFVVRPILNSRPSSVVAELAPPSTTIPPTPFSQGLVDSDSTSLPALTGEIDGGTFNAADMAAVSGSGVSGTSATALGNLATERNLNELSNDPVIRLKQMIEHRQEETIDTLRGWMEDSKETV